MPTQTPSQEALHLSQAPLLVEWSRNPSQIFLRLCALTTRISASHMVIETESALITGADTWNRL
jgi:hypothetical protein